MFNKIKTHTIGVDELINMCVIMDMDGRYHYQTTLNSEFDVLGLIAHDKYRSILDHLHNGYGVGVARSKFGLPPNARPEIGTLQDFRGAFRSGSGEFDLAGDQSLYGHGCDDPTAKWIKIDLSEISSFDELEMAFCNVLNDWSSSVSRECESFKGESVMVGCDIRIPNTDIQTHDIAKDLQLRLKPSVFPIHALESYFVPELNINVPHLESNLNRTINAYQGIIEARFRVYHVKPIGNDLSDNKDISTLLPSELGYMDTVTGDNAFRRVEAKASKSSDSKEVPADDVTNILNVKPKVGKYERVLGHFNGNFASWVLSGITSRIQHAEVMSIFKGMEELLKYPSLITTLDRYIEHDVNSGNTVISITDAQAICSTFNLSHSGVEEYFHIFDQLQKTNYLSKSFICAPRTDELDDSELACRSYSNILHNQTYISDSQHSGLADIDDVRRGFNSNLPIGHYEQAIIEIDRKISAVDGSYKVLEELNNPLPDIVNYVRQNPGLLSLWIDKRPTSILERVSESEVAAVSKIVDRLKNDSTLSPKVILREGNGPVPQDVINHAVKLLMDEKFLRKRKELIDEDLSNGGNMEIESKETDDNLTMKVTTRYHFVTANLDQGDRRREVHYYVDAAADELGDLNRKYWLTEKEVVKRLIELKERTREIKRKTQQLGGFVRGLKHPSEESPSLYVTTEGARQLTLDDAVDRQNFLIELYHEQFGEGVLTWEADEKTLYLRLLDVPTDGDYPETITLEDIMALAQADDTVTIQKRTLFDLTPDDALVNAKELYTWLVVRNVGGI